MANGRKLDAWDGDAGAIPEAMDAAFATSQAKHKGERREHGRDVGEAALMALMALILPAVLPGGAAYGAAGGLAGAGRALGQRAGGYQIPGSSGAMGPPRPGSVQAGASSFQPGAGGMFWGGGRGLPGRKPMVTQGQTLGGMSARPGDVGRGRLPGTPGPRPEYTPSSGASFHGMTGTPIRNHPQFVSGPQGTTRIAGRPPAPRAGGATAAEDAFLASTGQTGLAGAHPSIRGELLYGRSGVPPYRPSAEKFINEFGPADMAGATGRQIAGGGLPGRSGVPVTPAQKAVQEVIGRNNARTRGATREQMGLKKADPHPGHNPNAPAEANAWDHLSAKLNVPDAKAWEIVQSLDDIAMQEIMHISPSVGGNVPFWPR